MLDLFRRATRRAILDGSVPVISRDSQTKRSEADWAGSRWRGWVILFLGLLLIGLLCYLAATSGPKAQAKRAIRQLGAEVTYGGRFSSTRYIGWTAFCEGPAVDDARLRLLLPHLRTLEVSMLLLYRSRVTDAGLCHVKGLPNLRWLDLGWTRVTDGGLVHLPGLTALEELYLNDTEVTDRGLDHLESLKNLKLLDLSGTSVSEERIDELETVLPNLYVVRPWHRRQ